tara:strand:+ start:1268 stop:1510 length:243 start_codon:yes stop_codon:yes gene_type:complete
MKKFSYLVDILHNKTIKYKKMNVLNELINDESKLNERISASLDRELSRQKLAGKEFISDDALDKLIDDIVKAELGDVTTE